MGIARTLSQLGTAGWIFLGVSLTILAFSVGCYAVSFHRRRRDARAVGEAPRHRSPRALSPPPGARG